MGFQSTKFYEGVRYNVYRDSLGIPTVGYGHKVLPSDNFQPGQTLTQDQVDDLYNQDYAIAVDGAEELISNYSDQPDIVQLILNDLVFNLGEAGFSKFVHTIAYLVAMEYAEAAKNLQDSLWYQQVGRRAIDICETLTELGNK